MHPEFIKNGWAPWDMTAIPVLGKCTQVDQKVKTTFGYLVIVSLKPVLAMGDFVCILKKKETNKIKYSIDIDLNKVTKRKGKHKSMKSEKYIL